MVRFDDMDCLRELTLLKDPPIKALVVKHA
jgi:hypothetical protein